MKSEKTINKTETQDHESGRFDAIVKQGRFSARDFCGNI